MIRNIGIACFVVALAVAGAVTYFYFGARKTAHVTVTCLDLVQLHSNLGVLNLPGYRLGKVIALDEKSKQVQGLMTLKVADGDLAESGAPQDSSIKLDTKLDVAFDANIPETVKAEVKSVISNALSVELKGMVRRDLADPYKLANSSSELRDLVKTLGTSRQVVFVSTIKNADALELKLADSAQVKGKGNVIEAGNYEIAATYQCEGLYKVLGKQIGVFYGVASLAYDQNADKIVPGGPVEIWKFDHSQAFR